MFKYCAEPQVFRSQLFLSLLKLYAAEQDLHCVALKQLVQFAIAPEHDLH